eukprot:CAMPEP_0198346450 /NCGR_PEP_ID=MMETSP1450-20131203/79725_1 /TAXON_ID=753684 ORGANISM="Madagascaria erythrocladiodes, Strain CCMP3234" /NCGR_SAMPLE_ID=MMETSP1450 /ASSEMBLY_ACC=CAM_ASM_001115 /LENGTH=41 /DNA_ID= /DNA_START= /DNA_END= /DNA_ORIENTATION=
MARVLTTHMGLVANMVNTPAADAHAMLAPNEAAAAAAVAAA